MSNKEDLALMAHLMRRAGFGANRDELEALVAKGYDAVVDELVDPPEELMAARANSCSATIPDVFSLAATR